jgi:DNA helicase HerA-like ATPase
MSVPSRPDLDRSEAPEVLGKVASPPNKESTCDEFYFWVRRDAVVERTQIVTTTSRLGGRDVRFYGLVTEVFRQGRPRSFAEACDGYDGDVEFEPPFTVPGVTFAAATILGTDPLVLAPPLEGSDVVLGGDDEARVAFTADEIDDDKRLAIGLIKNGGTRLAGPGCIDLDYLLGENGAHFNVNGVAGRGTKSSLLLHLIYLLERKARRQAAERPMDKDRLQVAPIILNVKNFDLFYIDRASTRFDADGHLVDWHALGIDDPAPFAGVEFFAPQARGLANPVDVGRAGVQPYSWALADIIRDGLFRYLFAEDDNGADNFEGVVLDIEDRLTREDRRGDEVRLSLDDQDGAVRTFRQLVGWVDRLIDDAAKLLKKHHPGTLRKFQRRLAKVVHEGDGVLRRDDPAGYPLDVRATDTRGARVIDLHALAATPGLQRFVVAAIFRQLVEERTGGRAISGPRYLIMLDELNRFAPRAASDPITRLIETVAAEMRSQGIILLGAQQQASLVSTRVIENAGIRALGRSGSMEMNRDVWKSLGESARRKAAALAINEKLLVQDSFREPMLVRIPMPPWALNRREARPAPAAARVRDEFDE